MISNSYPIDLVFSSSQWKDRFSTDVDAGLLTSSTGHASSTSFRYGSCLIIHHGFSYRLLAYGRHGIRTNHDFRCSNRHANGIHEGRESSGKNRADRASGSHQSTVG
jgi:hypothetical protein